MNLNLQPAGRDDIEITCKMKHYDRKMSLYGVEFSRGKFIRPVYCCSPRRLLTIGLFIEITMSAGASGGNEWYAYLESP